MVSTRRGRYRRIALPLALSCLASWPIARAQEKAEDPAGTEAAGFGGPEDALGRGTLRGSLVGLLNAADQNDFE